MYIFCFFFINLIFFSIFKNRKEKKNHKFSVCEKRKRKTTAIIIIMKIKKKILHTAFFAFFHLICKSICDTSLKKKWNGKLKKSEKTV
jgi:hypothetical protein